MSMSVSYSGYRAKTNAGTSSGVKSVIRPIYRFLKINVLYNTILYPYGRMRQNRLLQTANRSQAHTYTCFFRSPLQLEALCGPVIDHLMDRGAKGRKLRVLVFACSNGAEAYTMASALMKSHPDLDFRIEASDLHQEMIDQATSGSYSRDEVFQSEYIGDEFVAATFDPVGDRFVVKQKIKDRVSFSCADLLSSSLRQQFKPADIVVAQNVLFHLAPDAARIAFKNVADLLETRSALFIEGADLDLKIGLTEEDRLSPLTFKYREIYEHSRSHIALAWWNHYYGAEPYSALRSNRQRRYSSIFLKGQS